MNEDDDLYHIYDPNLFNINDFDILLHEILNQTRGILNAEAGSIYIKEDDALSFNIFQNDAMSYENIYRQFYSLKDVKLPLTEQQKYLAVKSFVTKKTIIIDDVYKSQDYDLLGVREYDKKFNYKTKSIITAPIIHPFDENTIGVIQLLNKSENDTLVNFNEKDKEMLSMVCSFIALSISKAKNDTEKLKKLNEELETTNKELEIKIEKEVKINQEKSSIIYHQSKLASMGEMIGNIAHQWRQPLNAISTIASGLNIKSELDNYDKNETINSLNTIVDTTKHLSQTIDDFRDFYKTDKNKKDFNFSKSIYSCLAITQASLSQNYIHVICNLDETITSYGFENQLKQAILNIINNARDAITDSSLVDETGVIIIDLKKEEEFIVLKIKDNAGGIEESIIPKIFNQNFSTKDKKTGTGIGLYMTKQIIEKHKGSLIEASNEDFIYKDNSYKGAVFTIKIQDK